MADPIFSLCYTTVRPHFVEEVLKRWIGRASKPANVEMIISYDEGDEKVRQAIESFQYITPQFEKGIKVVVNKGPKNCVSGWNEAAKLATGDILIAVADDFNVPVNWDRGLTDLSPSEWWKQEIVVWVRDGYNADLLTLGILSRKRYERFGYLFYHGYQSLFSDTELTYVASQDRVIIDARHLLFEHLHPDCGKRVRDESDLKHASKERWNFGETLFKYRLSMGFPLDDGPRAAEYAAKPVRYAVVVQAIRDDLCLYEVIERILDESVKLSKATELGDCIEKVYVFAPDQRWDGAPAVIDEVLKVKKIVEDLNRLVHVEMLHFGNISVEFVPFSVRAVANVTQERIKIETDCRNWYQRFCQAQGFEHCIIMDGDELWKPGLLPRMNEMVRERWPMSIFTGMIPVAGLPGYPIEGALDKATIYARADARFEMCRGAFGYRHELHGYDIYHFSATRRTLDEIAGKHLGSGHADDKDYAMADWVKDTLMAGRIKPGLRDAHMYRKLGHPNVWPLVRAWKKEELAELPVGLLRYLGT